MTSVAFVDRVRAAMDAHCPGLGRVPIDIVADVVATEMHRQRMHGGRSPLSHEQANEEELTAALLAIAERNGAIAPRGGTDASIAFDVPIPPLHHYVSL